MPKKFANKMTAQQIAVRDAVQKKFPQLRFTREPETGFTAVVGLAKGQVAFVSSKKEISLGIMPNGTWEVCDSDGKFFRSGKSIPVLFRHITRFAILRFLF